MSRNVLTSGLIEKARAYRHTRLEIVQSNSMRHGEKKKEKRALLFPLAGTAPYIAVTGDMRRKTK